MANPVTELLSDGLSSPLGEVIAAVGRGVADAQAALDAASLKATLDIYAEDGDAGTALLREIGYQPTFYVLPETSCEVQVSMRIGGTGAADGSAGNGANAGAIGRTRTYVTPVDAGFQQRYGFLAQGATKLTFKIVPVPPPAAVDGTRPVPDLAGLSVKDAAARLLRVDFNLRVLNADGTEADAAAMSDKMVSTQDMMANSLRPSGSIVTVMIIP